MTYRWAHYKANLAGEIKTYDTDPREGYYELRNKREGTRRPVALLLMGDPPAWKVFIDGKKSDRPAGEVWTYVCTRPIPYATYIAVTRDGQPWPDAAPSTAPREAVIGDNSGDAPDPYAEHKTQLEEELHLIKSAKPPTTQEEADRIGNWINRVAKLKKWFGDIYKVESRPLLDQIDAVRAKYLHPEKEADDLAKALTRLLDPWVKSERDRLMKEAAEENRRRVLDAEAAEAARVAAAQGEGEAAGGPNTPPPPTQPEQTAMALPVQPEKVKIGGATGRSVHASTKEVGIVTDYRLFAVFLITGGREGTPNDACLEIELRQVLDKIARRLGSTKSPAPGMTMKEETKARR